MVTQSKVTRDVRSAIVSHGRIGGRNPISELCRLTGHESVAEKKLVEAAVHELGRTNEFVVDRDKGKIASIMVKKTGSVRFADRTEMSAQSKKEQMYAKGVPSFLPDELCSPVVISHTTPRVKPAPTQPEEPMSSQPEPEQTPELPAPIAAHSEPVYLATDPYDVTLTKCLNLLQEMADAEGVGHELSVHKVLMQMANMTPGRAERAMDHLRGMSLYTSQKVGYQKSSYLVDMTVKTVTPEMVQQFRTGGNIAPVAEAPVAEAEAEVEQPAVEAPGVQIAGSEPTLAEATQVIFSEAAKQVQTTEMTPKTATVTAELTVAEIIEAFKSDSAEVDEDAEAPAQPEPLTAKIAGLLDIVDRQDRELGELRSAKQRMETELATATLERDSLAAENDALRAEIRKLRNKPVVVSPLEARIDSALARHR